ncbi:enolase-like [Agrilus planipennis]|uniref:Enolase n=1 Tax=Agrilus planipennis TaxID=224129 RepID=A0A1W4X713_AGRPL|nr:enolase-like [Agrilus planipennis]
MPIRNLYARQIFDCRGHPTVEVDLITELGLFRASVPAGVTTTASEYEAVELRDNEKNNFHGMSVFNAVDNINDVIAPEIKQSCFEVTQQKDLDNLLLGLDGTPNKSRLGVNATLAVSVAIAKAGAAKRGVPLYRHVSDLAGNRTFVLPVPCFNVITGGIQAGNKIPFEEFLIMPTGATSFADAMKMGTEVYHNLKKLLLAKYGTLAFYTTEEGAFAPNIKNPKDLLTILNKAIDTSKYKGRVEIAMDCGASTFYKKGKYDLNFKQKKSNPKSWLTADKLMKQYLDFIKKFPICSIEDPFNMDDSWKDWKSICEKTSIQVVGDYLTVSHPERIKQAIEMEACNCVSLKLNQAGTLTEIVQACMLAKQNGLGTVLSHRTGDTEDTYISDIVVGLKCGQLKGGAPSRSERMAKYNQLLRIEEELGPYATYAGKAFQNPA